MLLQYTFCLLLQCAAITTTQPFIDCIIVHTSARHSKLIHIVIIFLLIVTAVFDDGRFGLSGVTSLIQNVSCSDAPTATSLNECNIADKCQTKCQYPIGLRCYGMLGPYMNCCYYSSS